MVKYVPEHSGLTVVWIVSHSSHLCIQASFPRAWDSLSLTSEDSWEAREYIYPDPGVEKLPGVCHFRQWGYVCVSKLHSAQNNLMHWNAIVSNCFFRGLAGML